MHNPDDGSIHIYDTKGHLTDSYQDSKIYQFEEDYVYNSRFIPVQKDGLYGLVDSDWNLVVPCRFKDRRRALRRGRGMERLHEPDEI